MLRYPAFVALRLATLSFFLVTWAYAVAVYSPFAFDMFIRPQLFPWLARFATWHHLWYCGAYLLSVATLIPDLSIGRDCRGVDAARRWVVTGYIVGGGLAAAYLVSNPLLPRLESDRRSLDLAILSLLPPVWLAVVDHLACLQRRRAWPLVDQTHALYSCLTAAGYLWAVHLTTTATEHDPLQGVSWTAAAIWSLAVIATASIAVFLVLNVISVSATAAGAPRSRTHSLTITALAIGMCEFVRRVVLPAVSFDPRAGLIVSAGVGATLALTWSGLVLRRPAAENADEADSRRMAAVRRAQTVLGLIAVSVAAHAALGRVERIDWNFVIQKLLMCSEWALTFALCRRLYRRDECRPWSVLRAVIPALAALATLYAIPKAGDPGDLLVARRESHADARVVIDRYASLDPFFRFVSDAVVERAGFDADYFRYLAHGTEATGAPARLPSVTFSESAGTARATKPDIFLFVIDSLRRDYLSPYNPAVDFTPGFDEFARENFVFRNAFTRYGGTWLAMPSIWAGGAVTRSWSAGGFERLNALEKLVALNGYRVAINDYTVAQLLRPPTPVTRLDPGVASVGTDLCHLLDSVADYLDTSAVDTRPVFTFLAPMNVHILNTRSGSSVGSTGHGGAFYQPYASRLARIDGCFARFVSYLKRTGRYDNSVIVITSDHGDSLGEDGNWGHQFFLFPEDIRVPLLVHLPDTVRADVTTDLARIAFSTDIAPTLYELLGQRPRDLGPMFGSSLFVPRATELASRRRESFLLMSSYGPTYGLLRRNGRFLYVSDLVNWREFSYDVSRGTIGTRLEVSEAVRRVNQRLILRQVEAVNAFYGRSAESK